MSETCPYCGSTASVKDSATIYGKSYGPALICDNFPACDSYATVYHEGKYMADKELRTLRKQCHNNYFDPLWKIGDHNRNWLYGRLKHFLGLTKEDAHFGKLTKEQCTKVIEAIKDESFLKVVVND